MSKKIEAKKTSKGKMRMRSEIVEAMQGLHKIGAVTGGELVKTTARMIDTDVLPKVKLPAS
jgi:hypothetical protein